MRKTAALLFFLALLPFMGPRIYLQGTQWWAGRGVRAEIARVNTQAQGSLANGQTAYCAGDSKRAKLYFRQAQGAGDPRGAKALASLRARAGKARSNPCVPLEF
jgi:hypothetical protein